METKLRKSFKKGMAIGFASVGLVLAGQALATPSLPGDTAVIFKYSDYEATYSSSGALVPTSTPIVAGDTLVEIFDISSINNASNPSITYWASGISDGTILTGLITGQVVNVSANGGLTLAFTGGTTTVYEVSTSSFNPTAPTESIAGLDDQICPGGVCPAAFLDIKNVAGISTIFPSATLVVTLDAITAPSTGQGAGDLLITGGSFASELGSNGVYNSDLSTCSGATGGFASICSGAGSWASVSEDPVTFVTTPEPGSLALLGAGLTGVALLRRGRAKSKVTREQAV